MHLWGQPLRYRRIDLNLLAALDVLLAERNVTRAAAAMNLTQSSMSGILARLREVFGDPLLVQVGRQLQLTPLAASLQQPTQEALMRIDALLLTRPQFDPATATRRFLVSASDYVVSAFLRDALQAVHHEAPGLTFDIVPTAEANGLDSGELDFVVVPAHMVSDQHPQAPLFDDGYTVVAWSGNTRIGERLTLQTYQQLGHVVFRGGRGPLPWFEQWYRNEHGDTRRVEVQVHSFSLLPDLVVGTERIATVQTRLAQRLAPLLPLRLLPLPMAAPRLAEVLQWSRLHDADPATLWLRDKMQALAAG